jgi:hypothetical protein
LQQRHIIWVFPFSAGIKTSCGHPRNILSFTADPAFELMVGDIRNPADCRKACEGVD